METGTKVKLAAGALGAAALAMLPTLSYVAHGADHVDSPSAMADPTADLTDLYAWMSADASKVNLVMNVHPFAGQSAKFSTAVDYVFHVNSSSAYGMAQTEAQIICRFYKIHHVECWGPGAEYAAGKADAAGGIMSASGKMKVYAGLRDDPFFFNLVGFQETVKAVVAAKPGLTNDANGCPNVNSATSTVLVNQLKTGMAGAAPANTFAGTNVLSLVIQVDKTLVAPAGKPVLGIWASTHQAQ